MGKFGALTLKRHVGWSNDFGFMDSLMREGGWVSPAERQAFGNIKLATRGVSKKTGKPTYTGCKKRLKQSQRFVCIGSTCDA